VLCCYQTPPWVIVNVSSIATRGVNRLPYAAAKTGSGSIVSNRFTLALAASIVAFFAAAAPVLSYVACFRHPLRLYQGIPALGGDGRQWRISSGGSKVRFGLSKLAVQVRGID
jgi:hypothetical protein